jgi:hypothetical protein
MKKILIALASIATAAIVNAASMNWGADYTYNASGTAGVDRGTTDAWIAYVFDASVTSYASAQTLFAANDGAGLAALAVGSTVVAGDDYGGFLGQSTFSGAAGDNISAYVVIFDGATVADASNMYISEVVTATAPSSGVPGLLTFGEGGDMVGMASAGAWTAAAVPEPTSGLLLLLGMAGLALRRKQI